MFDTHNPRSTTIFDSDSTLRTYGLFSLYTKTKHNQIHSVKENEEKNNTCE